MNFNCRIGKRWFLQKPGDKIRWSTRIVVRRGDTNIPFALPYCTVGTKIQPHFTNTYFIPDHKTWRERVRTYQHHGYIPKEINENELLRGVYER